MSFIFFFSGVFFQKDHQKWRDLKSDDICAYYYAVENAKYEKALSPKVQRLVKILKKRKLNIGSLPFKMGCGGEREKFFSVCI